MKPVHGGDLALATRNFGIPKEDWLDLSTGINPRPWPVPAVPARVWSRLPWLEEELLAAARDYYGCTSVTAVPGTQGAIQALPSFFPARGRVAIPHTGYREHLRAWQAAGHGIRMYRDEELDALAEDPEIRVLLLINPNNPGCQLLPPERIQGWLKVLRGRGAVLVIDEAFMDVLPQYSIARPVQEDSLIILRSIGKFFGLAGLRLGFVIADPARCAVLRDKLGPWAVNGPAQWLGARALADRAWQQEARDWLQSQAVLLRDCLAKVFSGANATIRHTPLFVTVTLPVPVAESWSQHMGRCGILIRLIEGDGDSAILRFGLPVDAGQLLHLQSALARYPGSAPGASR